MKQTSNDGSGRITPDRLVLSWRARDGACPRPQPWRRTACTFGPKKAVRWEVTRQKRGRHFHCLQKNSSQRRESSRGGELCSSISLCPSGYETSMWWVCVRNTFSALNWAFNRPKMELKYIAILFSSWKMPLTHSVHAKASCLSSESAHRMTQESQTCMDIFVNELCRRLHLSAHFCLFL